MGIILPILNLLFLSKGLDLATLGLGMALYSLSVVLLELPTGVFADLFGRRLTWIVSAILFLLGYGLAFFALGGPAVILALLTLGAARAFSSGSLDALFLDRWIEERGAGELHRYAAAINLAETLGVALGALLGGLLPDLFKTLTPVFLRGRGPYDGNLLVQVFLVLLNLILVLAFVPADRGHVHRKREGEAGPSLLAFLRRSLADLRGNRTLLLLLLGTLAWGLSISAVELLWQPRFESILGPAGPSWAFGFLSFGYFAAAALGNLVSPLLIEGLRIPSSLVLSASRLLTGLGIVVLAGQEGLVGFAAFYVLMFAFNGLGGPADSALFNGEIQGDNRASLLSLSSLFLQVGGAIGSWAFGLLALGASIPRAWLVAGGLFSASSLLYLAIGGRRR